MKFELFSGAPAARRSRWSTAQATNVLPVIGDGEVRASNGETWWDLQAFTDDAVCVSGSGGMFAVCVEMYNTQCLVYQCFCKKETRISSVFGHLDLRPSPRAPNIDFFAKQSRPISLGGIFRALFHLGSGYGDWLSATSPCSNMTQIHSVVRQSIPPFSLFQHPTHPLHSFFKPLRSVCLSTTTLVP